MCDHPCKVTGAWTGRPTTWIFTGWSNRLISGCRINRHPSSSGDSAVLARDEDPEEDSSSAEQCNTVIWHAGCREGDPWLRMWHRFWRREGSGSNSKVKPTAIASDCVTAFYNMYPKHNHIHDIYIEQVKNFYSIFIIHDCLMYFQHVSNASSYSLMLLAMELASILKRISFIYHSAVIFYTEIKIVSMKHWLEQYRKTLNEI